MTEPPCDLIYLVRHHVVRQIVFDTDYAIWDALGTFSRSSTDVRMPGLEFSYQLRNDLISSLGENE